MQYKIQCGRFQLRLQMNKKRVDGILYEKTQQEYAMLAIPEPIMPNPYISIHIFPNPAVDDDIHTLSQSNTLSFHALNSARPAPKVHRLE